MLSGTELDILSVFFPTLQEKTTKDIESATTLSHETVFRILKSLVSTGHLAARKVGNASVFRFLPTDDSLLIYTYFMSKRLAAFRQRHPLLHSRLKEYCASLGAGVMILFGSYAKGTQTTRSDIDLLVSSLKTSPDQLAAVFRTKYGISIRPAAVSPVEFRRIQKDNKQFYDDLRSYGIVFCGLEAVFKGWYGP